MNSKNYQHQLSSNENFHDGAENSGDSEFLAISLKRLAVLSLITGGLYQIYWFCKNWKAVKQTEISRIIPSLRGILTPIFGYSLFKKILFPSGKSSSKNAAFPAVLAASYILLVLVGAVLGFYATGYLMLLSLVSFAVIPLLFVQQKINSRNEKTNRVSALKKEFSICEVTTTVIGMLATIITLYCLFIFAAKSVLIKKMVAEAKLKISFPQQIDEVTNLVDISAQRDAVRYSYKIFALQNEDMSDETLKNFLRPNVCKNLMGALNQGINAEYKYEVEKTGKDFFIRFEKEDCAGN